MKKGIAASTCIAALGVSSSLAAQTIDNIGNQGQIVIGAERLAGLFFDRIHVESSITQNVGGQTFSSSASADTSTTQIALFGNEPGVPNHIPRLTLDYFPIDGLSIGAAFVYVRNEGEREGEVSVTVPGSGTQTEPRNEDVGPRWALVVGPRIGYAVAFDETVGLWPRVGFLYSRIVQESTSTTTDVNGNPIEVTQTTKVNLYHLTLEGLLFVSPFSQFALVGGPFVDIGLGGDTKLETTEPGAIEPDAENKVTSFGLTIGIAAYFP